MGYAEGDHRPGPLHHQDQDHRSPREEVLRLDRRLHPVLPVHLPANVDLQAGVRRVWPPDRPPQVLLSTRWLFFFFYRSKLSNAILRWHERPVVSSYHCWCDLISFSTVQSLSI